ncbi:MAG TPA: hypothetical protein VJP77_01605 [Planctomycetota bacterium]|nr:hypothetical protein [Planctomycetota bacterium]
MQPYTEVNRRKPAFVLVSLALVWLLVAGLFVRGALTTGGAGGERDVAGLAVGFVLVSLVALWIWLLRVEVRVERERLRWRFWPMWGGSVPLADVASVEPVRFRPIRDYGGWGLRWSPWAGWCVTIGGRAGVRLTRRNGRKLLLESARPEELAAAIERARSGA